jgi:hypothetical protein
MEASKLTILVNEKYDVNCLPKFIVVNTDDIKEGNLCDTYSMGSQWTFNGFVDHEDACDFCLENEASAMADEIKQYLVDDCIVDCEEDDIEVSDKGVVTINGQEYPGLQAYATTYDEENREYTLATYVNYTKDGKGMSLILDCQLPERVEFHRLGDYDSEEAKLADVKDALELFPNFDNPEVFSIIQEGEIKTMTTYAGVAVRVDPSKPWVAEMYF